MIVQCEACQTRFRLADEKVKPGGIKVRCSKCKEIFTVVPPEPEPAEETVDFDSFNMEKVTDDAPGEEAPDSESSQTDATEAETQPEPEPELDSSPESDKQPESSDLDFSTLESEMASDTGPGEELADDFSFADTSQPAEDDSVEVDMASSDFDISAENESQVEQPAREQTGDEEQKDFSTSFAETEASDGPVEFDFSEDSGTDTEEAESTEMDFSTEESTEPSEFSFDDDEEEPQAQEESGESSVDGDSDDGDDDGDYAFSFDDDEEDTSSDESEESSEPEEFSFDDESSSGDDSPSEWGDESSSDATSFDFETPSFETEDSPAESRASTPEEGGLQFGEIDFADDDEESEAANFQADDDFSKATMQQQEEPEPFTPSQPNPPPPSRDYDDEPLPAPPPPKKGPLSRILVLLVLLLVILGGAAGYLYMQEGTLNLNTVAKYLPFLQEYIGEDPASSPGDRISIDIAGSSYVNGQAGQMLVIQGSAVNNHSATLSAITVKGVLLGANDKLLLQQTVFCGNQLNDATLQTMSFAAIEEAMNNQFGDSLSNMNVAVGASIPFTIVFRNLPSGIANINVEVVDSKPGAG
ncbi:MAG: zinc-ribbon domain-containing protein [Deltaproteobacteria bacterium]|nr:zinc-ribbon domain-containing protein [Deltaproteobacteria bacterium]